MKVQIDKQNLNYAVNIVSKAVPGKTTLSILQCILIDAAGQNIRIIANDTELGIQTTVQGEIIERGVAAVNADIFANIVRKIPDGTVTISSEGEKITIRCGSARFNILGRDSTDFHYLPDIDRDYQVSMTQYTLKNIIAKTLFSISTNESNKVMTGELFEIKDNFLRVISLDGHRISIRRTELNRTYENRKVIIPGKTLNEIGKILSNDTDKPIDMFFTDKHVMFSFDETLIVSRLIDGEYFDVDRMLSNDYETMVRINRQELLSCLDRATLLVKEDDKKPVILMIRDDEVHFKINTTLGSMDETIAIDKQGEDMNIGFNPKFLIEALRVIDEDTVDIYLLSSRAPAFIKDEDSYCYMVLPVNFVNID